MGVGLIVSMVVGAVLALGTAVGLTSTVSSDPAEPVDAPYVVYGES